MLLENGLWKVSSSNPKGHQGNYTHFPPPPQAPTVRDHDKCSWEKDALESYLSTWNFRI